jgi:hypothetical protein
VKNMLHHTQSWTPTAAARSLSSKTTVQGVQQLPLMFQCIILDTCTTCHQELYFINLKNKVITTTDHEFEWFTTQRITDQVMPLLFMKRDIIWYGRLTKFRVFNNDLLTKNIYGTE